VALEYDKSGFLKKMIVRFKYKFSKELSEVLANILLTQIINVFGGFEDCYEKIVIVPVPIHKKKMRQRGFNQSHLLASHLAKKFDLKMIDCLRRTKCTNSQAMLGRSERLQNVVNSMKIAKGVEQKNLRRKMVLIIDDIATTGSTLNECARILKENGVSWVCGLVIARSR
jgi:ComF family protein